MATALQEIREFLELLQQRERLSVTVDTDAEEKQPTLIFANALLRNRIRRQYNWPLPPQLVVLGPTQSGKSSVVNLLLGQKLAEASPLAGHTRYAQGFTSRELSADAEQCLDSVLPGWQRVEPGNSGEGSLYALFRSDRSTSFARRASIVWDTPDFDSVGSRSYRNTVPEICALADGLLLVVSREKYADRAVWRMLRLVAPLGIPLMICLNKTDHEDEMALRASLDKRLQFESITTAGTVSLPYIEHAEEALADTTAAADLRKQLDRFLVSSEIDQTEAPLIAYLEHHWAQWTAPLRQELAAFDYWREVVESGIEEALDGYRREYLDNPHYSYALQHAILRLLELLEIPGLAGTLTKVRSVLTWPARRLQALFKEHFPGKDPGGPEQEAGMLRDLVSHLLIGLRDRANGQLLSTEGATQAWWRELLLLVNNEQTRIIGSAQAAVADYQASFELEIEEASQRLYRHLQQHPATLNGLRAARVSTDTAAIVLAVKTGGVGVNDLILTPAMLSFTSLLAEGAVGGYMKQIEAELGERQLALLKQGLFQDLLAKQLLDLPHSIPEEHCYAVSHEQLEQAERSLEALLS